jgi:hypothetical protein
MKNVILALTLLLVLFGATVFNMIYVENTALKLIEMLEEGEAYADSDEWSRAWDVTANAKDLWERSNKYLNAVLRHSETDDIYTEFHSVLAFIICKAEPEYKASNASLKSLLEHIYQMEKINLQNIV